MSSLTPSYIPLSLVIDKSIDSGKPMLPEDPLDSSSDWVCKETGEMLKLF